MPLITRHSEARPRCDRHEECNKHCYDKKHPEHQAYLELSQDCFASTHKLVQEEVEKYMSPVYLNGSYWGATERDADGREVLVEKQRIYYLFESYVGKVMATRCKEERIMSDVWAYCYYATVMEDNGTFRETRYADSEFGGGNGVVDASPEIQELYRQHLEKEAAERAEMQRKADEARVAVEKKEPRKGRQVKVVRGRKVAKGTTGECIWRGSTRYGERVGASNLQTVRWYGPPAATWRLSRIA